MELSRVLNRRGSAVNDGCCQVSLTTYSMLAKAANWSILCFGLLQGIGAVPAADGARMISKEDALFATLMKARSGTLARPVTNVSDPVRINVTAFLLQILDMDAKEQAISISAYMLVKWREPRFTWDPTEYDGLSQVVFDAKHMWVPDIGLVNSLDGIFDFSKGNEFRVQINHDGSASWYPGGTFRVPCPLDLTYFPFDKQTCTFVLSSWNYNSDALKLYSVAGRMIVENVISQTEWGIENISMYNREIVPGAGEGTMTNQGGQAFSFIFIDLSSARDPMYYVTNIILPAVLLSLLVLTVFFLPCESGEKVSLGITILLAFTVFQLVVAETLPPNTKSTPLVIIYLTILMTTTAISTVASVVILNIHYMHPDTELPKFARHLVYDVLARLVCFKTHHRLLSRDPGPMMLTAIPTDDPAKPRGHENRLYSAREPTNGLGSCPDDIANTLREINEGLKTFEKRHQDSNVESETIDEWKEAANIVDRFLMWIYLVSLLCLTLGFFLSLERARYHS